MIKDKRYILITFIEVTQQIIDNTIQTSFDTLRHVRFEGDATDWVVLKWRGDKPDDLFNEFPVYSDQEIKEILVNDLNSILE